MENSNSYIVSINTLAARYLYKSANWTIFFSILGYILAGIMIIVCLGLILGAGALGAMGNPTLAQLPFSLAWFGVIYLPLALLYIWISTLMLGFASKAKEALKQNDDGLIEQSFRKMSRFLTMMGIVTIVGLSFYFIMMIVMIVGGITGTTGAML